MLRVLSILACAGVLFAGQARAETYRLSYEAAVLGAVVLGTVSYEVASSADQYAVRANVRTSGLARLFDQTEINATSTGAISAAGASWSRYDISHAYSGKFRRINLTRGASGVAAQVDPAYGGLGQPAASAAQQSSSYDPLTAVFALGSQIGAARACRGAVLVFDGRQHYRLSVSGGSQAAFNSGGYNGQALTCQFRYEPISGFSMTAQERARIPVGQAVFALPEGARFAPPVRLSVPTPAGDAVLSLSAYQRAD